MTDNTVQDRIVPVYMKAFIFVHEIAKTNLGLTINLREISVQILKIKARTIVQFPTGATQHEKRTA